MAVYFRPVAGVPPWVRERIDTQGLEGAISVLSAEATTASGAGDSTNATALNAMVSAMRSSAGYVGQHGASARNSIMVIRKA